MKRHNLRRHSSRVAKFEPLESREMLSVSPGWLSTIGGGGQSFLVVPYVAAHDAGGFTITGRFGGTVDFDPGPGEALLTNTAPPFSGDVDIVVARYTESGEL